MVYVIALLAAAACFQLLMPARPAHKESAGWLGQMALRLRQRHLPLTPQQHLTLMVAIPLGTFVLIRLLSGAWLTALICLPAGPLVLAGLFEGLARRRNQLLRDHLQEALLSLAASLKAGQSLVSALARTVTDLERLHPRGSPILEELSITVRDVQMGLPVDQALLAFRERVPLEEVASLVDAVVITRRRGGNIVEVMGNVAHMIADRMAIDREIQVMTAQKRAEAAILSFLPLGLYLIIRITSPGYLAVFQESVGGQVALGLIFLAIIFGYWMANRLARIDL